MGRLLQQITVGALCVFLLAGCGVSRQSKVIAAGGKKLSGADLYELLEATVIALEEPGMTGRISFGAQGKMKGTNSNGDKDTGRWQVDGDRLCLKFRTWSYGDRRCYTIVAQGDQYLQFNSKGLPEGSFRVVSPGPQALSRHKSAQGERPGPASSRSVSAASREGTTSVDEKQDVDMIMRNMAKNCPSCNLAGARLAGAMLVGANLEEADLRRADLRNAVLRKARLKNAYLPGARLSGADLAGADLRGADLSGADLTGANLYKARFEGALLKGVRGADWTGAYR